LSIMPPATGLPSPRSSSLAAFIDSVPHAETPNGHVAAAASDGSEHMPMRYTNHHEEHASAPAGSVDQEVSTETVHG
jgi:hypothetical protein